MIYILIVIFLSIFFCITLYFNHKQIPFIIFAASAIFLLFVSSLLYSFRMSGVYNSHIFITFGFIYKMAAKLKISFSDIYRISLIGSFLIYLSCIAMTFSMASHIRKFYVPLMFIPLYAYLFINDPDMNFRLYINSAVSSEINRIVAGINMYNIILTAIYFLMPIAAIFVYYRHTSFVIKRRHSILMLVYTITYYLLILIMNGAGLILFLHLGNADIIKYYSSGISDFEFSAVITIICVIVLLIVILTIRTSKMQNYSTGYVIKNTNVLDKNLRMILHTYKNHFFAINQQIKFLKALNEPYSEKTAEIINSIDEISQSSIDEISERINSLKNVKIFYKPIDLTECADKAIEKVFIPQNIRITREYCRESAVIFSESKYIVEMIANIIQNSVEAIEMKEEEPNPEIRIKVQAEIDWILLEITDNGCGISSKQKKHIFTPLFSMKQGKNNFGVGLHYVKKIVAAHHGYIFVDSVLGKYTKFQIYLQKNNEQSINYEEKGNRLWSSLKSGL